MEFTSKSFEKILREANFKFKINRNARAWFVSQTGEILEGHNHSDIIKEYLKAELEFSPVDTLEKRLIDTGWVKISKLLNRLVFSTKMLNSIEKDIISGFASAIENIDLCIIYILFNGDKINCMLQDLRNDFLFTSV
jgi:hypothetical protein